MNHIGFDLHSSFAKTDFLFQKAEETAKKTTKKKTKTETEYFFFWVTNGLKTDWILLNMSCGNVQSCLESTRTIKGKFQTTSTLTVEDLFDSIKENKKFDLLKLIEAAAIPWESFHAFTFKESLFKRALVGMAIPASETKTNNDEFRFSPSGSSLKMMLKSLKPENKEHHSKIVTALKNLEKRKNPFQAMQLIKQQLETFRTKVQDGNQCNEPEFKHQWLSLTQNIFITWSGRNGIHTNVLPACSIGDQFGGESYVNMFDS
jgi:hypothetical protein